MLFVTFFGLKSWEDTTSAKQIVNAAERSNVLFVATRSFVLIGRFIILGCGPKMKAQIPMLPSLSVEATMSTPMVLPIPQMSSNVVGKQGLFPQCPVTKHTPI